MATATKKKDAPATGETFEFTCSGRDVIGQIGLNIPDTHGSLRQAAQAAFLALYDQGSNSPTTVTVHVDTDTVTVTVRQGEYVHGE